MRDEDPPSQSRGAIRQVQRCLDLVHWAKILLEGFGAIYGGVGLRVFKQFKPPFVLNLGCT